MCRLYGFIATEPTKVECSLLRAQNALLKQSRLDSRGFTHPDGWGIAYYVNALPVVDRRSRAAYKDLQFDAAAELVYARVVVAHVRAASVGVPSTANTHPFHLGRWVFAHNGTIPRFEKVGPRLEASTEAAGLLRYRRGNTDSELAFLWILGRIRRVALGGLEGDVPVEQMVRAVQDALLSIESWCRDEGATEAPSLNFLLTDGRCLVASRRGNTAYWILREDAVRCEVCGVCHCSICGSNLGRRHEPRSGYRAVVVASEPITRESWAEIPEGHLLAVDDGLNGLELVRI